MRDSVEVVPDKRALMEAAAAAFAAAARAAIAAHGRFVTALSGGSTLRALFELLATERVAASIDWGRIQVCWGDLVSGGDKASMLHRVLDGPVRPDTYPAQIVAPHHGRLRWLVDTDAAAELEER